MFNCPTFWGQYNHIRTGQTEVAVFTAYESE
ncbi:Hok/Gef family protein [Escherichia coli]